MLSSCAATTTTVRTQYFLHSVLISLVFPPVCYGQLNKAVKLTALDMKRTW